MSRIIKLFLIMIIVIFALYWQVINSEFVNLDDTIYVVDNPYVATGLNIENIVWAFTSFDNAAGLYLPIPFLTHMVDVQLYGMKPGWHHLTNVFIHACASFLLLILLSRVTGSIWSSTFVAAMFALHPLSVESVAWVTERKDVLSAFFMFITLLLYGEYVARKKAKFYILSLVAFVLGLMSKPMLVTVPVVLLLLDYWPLNRYQADEHVQGKRNILHKAVALFSEKIPYFLLSIAFGLITIYMQHSAGATQVNVENPFWFRLENALTAYVKYILKIVWPQDLAVYYPYPSHIPFWQVGISLLFLLLVSLAVLRAGRRYPFLPVGWFWFLLTLVPVIGLLQAGHQSMADRFTYIPKIGLLIIFAWGAQSLLKGVKGKGVVLTLLAAATLSAATLTAWNQLGFWRDSITLFQHTLKVAGGSFLIHNNLGLVFANKGRLDEAIDEFQKAIQLSPGKVEAHNNLGLAYAGKGFLDDAIHEYLNALRIAPDSFDVFNNLGIALARKGYMDEAISNFRQAISLNPRYARAYNNLGLALMSQGLVDQAIMEYQRALAIHENYLEAQRNLQFAIAQKKYMNEIR